MGQETRHAAAFNCQLALVFEHSCCDVDPGQLGSFCYVILSRFLLPLGMPLGRGRHPCAARTPQFELDGGPFCLRVECQPECWLGAVGVWPLRDRSSELSQQ